MIKEISNFIERIPEEFFTEGIEPAEGLHILIDLDEEGNLQNKRSYLVKTEKKEKKYYAFLDNELSQINSLDNISIREFYSGVINMNKCFDLPAKKIHSSSPYVIWFKKENIDRIINSYESYFKKSKNYSTEIEYDKIDLIHHFCEESLINLIKDDYFFDELKTKNYIKIYFDVEMDKLKMGYKNYLGDNLFNKADYNVADDEFGLSDFLNGDNIKKAFLMHRTSRFIVNNRISKKEALNLNSFKLVLQVKPSKLPNPLPIFIDENELNNRVVELYNREKVLKFHEIINKLFRERLADINNYYLINWSKKGGLTINDVDFVSNFEYNLENFKINNLFDIKNTFEGYINNIFHFEIEIVQKLFNNLLIQKTKDEQINFRYFDDLDYNPKYMTKNTFLNTLKYRKLFYDFIYKSRRDLITNNIFYSILISGIIDDIKHDEYKDNYHTKERNIKEKLNILFSLNINFGGKDMASKMANLNEKLRKLLNEEDYHLKEDDEEFAFDAGQLIYYILYQSESSNKTHAMLEPYISKNDPDLFILTITRGIEQYKHKFPFGTKKFPKLASEILGYKCKTKIKELLPIILAGYFSHSLLFESSKTKQEN